MSEHEWTPYERLWAKRNGWGSEPVAYYLNPPEVRARWDAEAEKKLKAERLGDWLIPGFIILVCLLMIAGGIAAIMASEHIQNNPITQTEPGTTPGSFFLVLRFSKLSR